MERVTDITGSSKGSRSGSAKRRAGLGRMVRRPGLLIVAAIVAVAGAAGLVAPGAAAGHVTSASSVTDTFEYRGPVAQSVEVPAGAKTADVRIVGGKGGGVSQADDSYITGGDGAQVTGRLVVSPGVIVTLRVGQRGGDGTKNTSPGEGGWGATGNGGRGGSAHGYRDNRDGGGGGGSSSLELPDCVGCRGSLTVLAGGGGGSGGSGFARYFNGGGPGGSSGTTVDPGHDGKGPGAGKGGGGGNRSIPHGEAGGNASNWGGGGGGGGAGQAGGSAGGGGGTGGGGGGGGGAGSSSTPAQLLSPSVVRGGTSDGNGLIAITWNDLSAPVCPDQTHQVPLNSAGVPVQLRCAENSRPTSFRIVASPDHGLLEHGDLTKGTFTCVPASGYSGPDSVIFQALTGDNASLPATVTFLVNQTVPSMALTASSTQVPEGHPPTLTVRMPTDATGHVGFYDAAQPGTEKGIGTADLVEGVATLTAPTRTLGVGTHTIHASYSGDGRYHPNDSNTVTVTVTAP
jgi:hypothetical protein